MRSMPIVMVLIFGKDPPQVRHIPDEDPIQDFSATGAYPALHDRVRARCSYRGHLGTVEQVDGEEVGGNDRFGLGAQELCPGRSGPSRRGVDSSFGEDLPTRIQFPSATTSSIRQSRTRAVRRDSWHEGASSWFLPVIREGGAMNSAHACGLRNRKRAVARRRLVVGQGRVVPRLAPARIPHRSRRTGCRTTGAAQR